MSALLTIPQTAAQALGPAQRKFNQLQKNLATAREELLAWDAATPPFAEAFEAQVRPLQHDVEELEALVVQRLDRWLAEPGWASGERRLMREALTDLVLTILQEHTLDASTRAYWQSIHDSHADESLAEQDAAQQRLLREQAKRLSGVDLGDQTFESADALLDHLQQRFAKMAAEEREAAATEEASEEPAAPRRPTKAQARRAAEQEAAQAQTRQGLREVYRRLASSLHPDRAPDADEAARRTALMQRVNAAYAKEDLLALLQLQLELEQIDAEHLRRASEAQIKHFNALLEQQLDELRHELDQRAHQFCQRFQLSPRSQPKPARLGPLLQEARRNWNAAAFEAQRDADALKTSDGVRRWIRRLKQQARAEAHW